MKTKKLLITIVCLGIGLGTQAQLLKKLKKKAENAAERALIRKTEKKAEKMTEAAFDSVTNTTKKKKNKQEDSTVDNEEISTSNNEAKNINTEVKNSFYTSDVIVTTSENGKAGSSFYFDADAIAMRGSAPDSEGDMYTDSEGFQYGYNDSEKRWEKTGIMKSDAMSFMMPAMSMSMLQLPSDPMLNAVKKFKARGMNLNTFMIVEWAFIYKPEHFRNEDYIESKIDSGTKFSYTDPEFEGSFVIFDEQNRLSKAYIKNDSPEGNKEGVFNFKYTPVEISIPNAVEVKMPMQDLLLGGLDKSMSGSSKNTEVHDGDSETSTTHASVKSMQKSLKNHKVSKDDLPNTYEFDWRYKLKMEMTKQDPMDLVFLLKKNVQYQGIAMDMKDMNGKGTMVFDSSLESLIMFFEANGSKMMQISPLTGPKDGKTTVPDFTVSELPNKAILGYNCKGLQMENNKYVVQVYHATGTPIEMTNFFDFSGAKKLNLPDIDPKLLNQFSNGLIMQMVYNDKKKSKNNLTLTAQSIDKIPTSIKKDDYQYMSIFGGAGMFKN